MHRTLPALIKAEVATAKVQANLNSEVTKLSTKQTVSAVKADIVKVSKDFQGLSNEVEKKAGKTQLDDVQSSVDFVAKTAACQDKANKREADDKIKGLAVDTGRATRQADKALKTSVDFRPEMIRTRNTLRIVKSMSAAMHGDVELSVADLAEVSAAWLLEESREIEVLFRLATAFGITHELWPETVIPKIVLDMDTVSVADKPLYHLKGFTPLVLDVATAYTWQGDDGDPDTKLTVLMDNTAGVVVGSALRANDDDASDPDCHWFEVESVIEDTSVKLKNPNGYTIPNGARSTSVGQLPAMQYDGTMTLVLVAADSGWLTAENMKVVCDYPATQLPDLTYVAAATINIPIGD